MACSDPQLKVNTSALLLTKRHFSKNSIEKEEINAVLKMEKIN